MHPNACGSSLRRLGDLQSRGPRRGQETTEEAHHDGEDRRLHGDLRREVETELDLGERGPVGGGERRRAEQGGEDAAGRSAEEREDQALDEEAAQHRTPAEAERAQGAHFAHARGHLRVHGDHRAQRRAEGEEDGDHRAEHADESGERPRSLLVKAVLALRFQVPARIGVDRRAQAVEFGGTLEPDRHRRIAGAARSVGDLIGVSPDLAFERRAACFQDADHLPLPARDGDALTDLRARVPSAAGAADDHFARSPLWRPPLDQLDALRSQELPAVTGDSAQADVGGAVPVGARKLEDDEQFRRGHLPPALDGYRRIGGERLGALAREEAGQLGNRYLAQDDGIFAHAGRLERLFHTARQHQHRGEDEHHQSETESRGKGGKPPAQDRAHVVREGNHSCLRSASMMPIRAACTAGNALAAAPMIPATTMVAMAVGSLHPMLLRKPNCDIVWPKPIRIGRARITPRRPPTAPSSAPSLNARIRMCLGKKPMARMAPSSGVRSRRPIASVLPRISAMMIRITPLTASSAERIAPEPVTNERRKAFSVSVCVSLSLLAKVASMSRITRGESFAFAIVEVKRPTVSLRLAGRLSLRRAQWKYIRLSMLASSGLSMIPATRNFQSPG